MHCGAMCTLLQAEPVSHLLPGACPLLLHTICNLVTSPGILSFCIDCPLCIACAGGGRGQGRGAEPGGRDCCWARCKRRAAAAHARRRAPMGPGTLSQSPALMHAMSISRVGCCLLPGRCCMPASASQDIALQVLHDRYSHYNMHCSVHYNGEVAPD